MDCKKIIEAKTDALTGNLDSDRERDLREHLKTCADCRRECESLERLWNDLGRLPVPEPAVGAADRFASEWKPRSLPTRRVEPRIHALWAAAATILLVLASWSAHRLGRDSVAVPVSGDTGRHFVLLLHERVDETELAPEVTAALVAEYSEWAGGLAGQGQLEAGEKLADEPGRFLTTTNGSIAVRPGDRDPGKDVLAGYFVIRAQDYDEAVSISRTCPHLKYGSGIEVRELERSS